MAREVSAQETGAECAAQGAVQGQTAAREALPQGGAGTAVKLPQGSAGTASAGVQEQKQSRTQPSLASTCAWTPPKTDWTVRDAFDLVPDYARVRGNLLYLHAVAARLYLPFALAPMREYAIEDVPELSFFTGVDGSTDALLNNTFCPAGTQRARTYTENGAVWTADDLNRMECAHVRLRSDMAAQENGRTALTFIMGGGLLGACL